MSRLTRIAMLAGLALAAAVPTIAVADPIKIGVNAAAHRRRRRVGQLRHEGAKIAADQINANGGVLGQQVELIIEDNKCNPTEAVAVAEKLIVRDKVPVMMGAWSSTLHARGHAQAQEYKRADAGRDLVLGKITTSGNPWVFRISPTSEMEAEAFAAAGRQVQHQEGGFLVVNNDWGRRRRARSSATCSRQHDVAVGAGRDHGPERRRTCAPSSPRSKRQAPTPCSSPPASSSSRWCSSRPRICGLDKRIITTGGSRSPDQLIQQAGGAANGSLPSRVLHALVPAGGEEPGRRQEVRRRMEEARLRCRRSDRRLSRLGRDHDHRRRDQGGRQGRTRRDPQGVLEGRGEGRQRRHRIHQAGAEGQRERAERAQRLRGRDRRRQGRPAVALSEPANPDLGSWRSGSREGCRQDAAAAAAS